MRAYPIPECPTWTQVLPSLAVASMLLLAVSIGVYEYLGLVAAAWAAGGLLIVACPSLWLVHQQRRRSAGQARRYLQSLEFLNEASAAISAKLGSHQQILDHLAEAARLILKMDRSGIVLIDAKAGRLEVAAHAGDFPTDRPRFYALKDLPGTQRVITAAEPVFDEDVSRGGAVWNPRVLNEYSAGCLIMIPLWREDRPIGVLMLSATRPRKFTDVDRRLARLLASQVAVTLANSHLYEQARRDAQTRQMLLSELNHRVKNNLAAIVTLLSIEQPALPRAAGQWLLRVTERIQTIARTHELLSSDAAGVSLRQVVEQILPSLAAVKGAHVRIRTDLAHDVTLEARQAMGLATALHELCFNALLHGLGDEGELLVRTAAGAEAWSSVEVVDNGRGFDTTVSGGPNGGGENRAGAMGLRLVRELVGREIRGRLSLESTPGQGTTARIEFPAAREPEVRQ